MATRTKPRPSPAADATRRASIVGAFGATGTGKSTYLKRELERAPGLRTVIFDPGHEYHCGALAASELEYFRLVELGTLSIVFRPALERDLRARQFDRFCTVALQIADTLGECRIVCDELHLVTEAGASPAAWRELITTGRKRGVSVLAASIRPASIDKDFFTNCTIVRTGRLNFVDDQRTLGNVLGVQPAQIAALTAGEFFERDLLTGKLARGRITF
jgi:hypothetical protein